MTDRVPHERRGVRLASRYALIGMLLGLGAPVGALLLRRIFGAAFGVELVEHAFFYLYALVGTCAVFAVAGWAAGRRADRLREGREELRRLADRDPLTGLANAGAFERHYRQSLQRASREANPVSLLLIDLDRLKTLNDELGHAFGSAALLHVAAVLERLKRDTDVSARWGGDEFTVLMPGADGAPARRLAEAIRDGVAEFPVRHESTEGRISVTVGVATWNGRGDIPDLFEAADRALYQGKRAGRGEVRAVELSSGAGRSPSAAPE